MLVPVLREAIIDHFAERGVDLDNDAGRKTLDTNSTLAEARADVLLQSFRDRSGHTTLAGLTVADLGCGFGTLAMVAAVRGARVVGVDPNRRRIRVGARVAAQFGLDLTFQQGTLQEPGLPSGGFDLVIVNNALCYVIDREDRRQALRSVATGLRPGAWTVLRDPNRNHPRDVFTGMPLIHRLPPRLANKALARAGVERSLVRMTSPGQAMSALRRAGLTSVRYDGAGSGIARRSDRLAGYHHVSGRRPQDS